MLTRLRSLFGRRSVAAVATLAVVGIGGGVVANAAGAAPFGRTSVAQTPAVLQQDASEPGKIAYVTPAGDVMVADSDGSSAVKIGDNAATNAMGLAPLAWRLPSGDSITYVRRDGALVGAPIKGGEPTIYATDAVVPADASDRIIGWDSTGSFLVYLAQPAPGRIESRSIAFSNEDPTAAPVVTTMGDPVNRRVRAQVFSPLDPILYLDSVDPDSGAPYTASVMSPLLGQIITSTFNLDDATFSPDGRYLFAVSRQVRGVEQLVRMSLRDPTRTDLVFDNERVCQPSMSPDGNYLVFGAGVDCSELWRLKADGTEPTLLASDISGTTFSVGTFSWSLDSLIVSHPSCQNVGTVVSCGGAYLDVRVADGTVTERASAGNVVRESRPYVRSVHVRLQLDGPIEYDGSMQVAESSVATELAADAASATNLKAIDVENAGRSFELKLVQSDGSNFLAGTIRVVDGGFDETVSFIGSATPYSLGYAQLTGVWTQSESVPLTSGTIVITLER